MVASAGGACRLAAIVAVALLDPAAASYDNTIPEDWENWLWAATGRNNDFHTWIKPRVLVFVRQHGGEGAEKFLGANRNPDFWVTPKKRRCPENCHLVLQSVRRCTRLQKYEYWDFTVEQILDNITNARAFLAPLAALPASEPEDYQPPVPGFGFLGYGYNVAKAHPFQSSGRLDKGFQDKIFDFTGADGKRTADGKYHIPDKTTAIHVPICTDELDTRFVSSESDFRRELRAGLSVTGNSSWYDISFHANAEYNSVTSTVMSGRDTVALTSAQCSAYRLAMNTFDIPPFRSDFIEAVRRLPDEYEETQYGRFVDAFGTHFVNRLDLGGRLGKIVVMDTAKFQQLQQQGINVDAGIEASSWGTTGSISGHADVDETAKTKVQAATSSVKDYSIGGTPNADRSQWLSSVNENPVPLGLSLTPVSELFNADDLPCFAEVIGQKKANLEQAIQSYCKYKGIDCSVDAAPRYQLGVKGENACPRGTGPVAEVDCLKAVQSLLPMGIQQGRKELVGPSRWGHVPQGCSVQSGGDWAAHYNLQQGNNGWAAYSPVCKTCQVFYQRGAKGDNTCPAGTVPVSQAECLQAVQAMLPSGAQQGRKQLVGPGQWHWVPPGCSVQSGGDWAAHYNSLQGTNDGAYSPVCKACSVR